MAGFNITYELVTHESAEHGEAEEVGFEMEGATLRDCYEFLRWNGGYCEASCSDITQADWLSFYGESDIYTGDCRNYGLHFPHHITGSTRRRIAKLFRCYGVR